MLDYWHFFTIFIGTVKGNRDYRVLLVTVTHFNSVSAWAQAGTFAAEYGCRNPLGEAQAEIIQMVILVHSGYITYAVDANLNI